MNIYETVKNGLPLDDILVIDAHCHMGYCKSQKIAAASAEDLIGVMDILGINFACVSHSASLTPDHVWGNEQIIEAVGRHPDRFIGYCALNPLYPEELQGEMEKCLKTKGMKGIKIIPSNTDRTMAYKNYKPVYEFAAEHKWHVLVHVYSYEEVSNMDRIAGEYPEATFLMAHMGGEVPTIEKAVDVFNRRANVYADFTGSETREGEIEWLVREIGAKKLLFGSDMPYFGAASTIGRVSSAEISENDKKDILGLNIKKILGAEAEGRKC